MELTRYNIAYNLSISPYRYDLKYDDDVITFVFSSALYMKKFHSRLEKNRTEINESLSKRFGFSIDFKLLADVRLYSSIEKRGFLLKKGGVEVTCREVLTLDGVRLTTRNLKE